MIYSVWDWDNGGYTYFEGAGEGRGVRPVPATVVHDGRGHKLEDVLPTVPAGAVPVGEGPEPRGRVATLGPGAEVLVSDSGGGSLISGFGATDTLNKMTSSPWVTLAMWAACVLAGYSISTGIGKRVAGVK